MIGSTNAGSAGNGGGIQAVAFIGVTYPEGSFCTCTNGAVTLIAENASGFWRFSIPSIGEWTIMATDNNGEESTETVIVEDGGVYLVELSYGILWVPYGDLNLWGTGRIRHTSESPARVSTSGTSYLTDLGYMRSVMNEGGWPTYSRYLINGVNLKKWNKVIFMIDPHIAWYNTYCIWNRDIYGTGVTFTSDGLVASADVDSYVVENDLKKITIDVSSIVDDKLYFIGFLLRTGAQANTYVDIAKVYLEK